MLVALKHTIAWPSALKIRLIAEFPILEVGQAQLG